MGATLTAAIDTATVSSTVTLDWNAKNYVTNPNFLQISGNNDWRQNNFINPRARNDTTGWAQFVQSAGTASASRVATGGPTGVADSFYRMTWNTITTGSIGSTGVSTGNSGSDTMVAAAAYPYTVSGYVRSSHTDREVNVVLSFHDSGGAQVGSQITGASVPVGGSAWVRVSVTSPVPTGAVRAIARFYASAGTPWAVGDTLDVTAVLAEYATVVMPFFDGTTPLSGTELGEGFFRSWTGSNDGSTSYTKLQSPVGPFTPYSPVYTAGGRVQYATDQYGMRQWARQTVPADGILAFGFSGNVTSTAGENWVGRFQVRQIGATQPVNMYARLGAYSGAGASLATGPVGASVDIPADGSWVDVIAPSITTPASTGTVRFLVYAGDKTLPAGTTVEYRHVLLEHGTGQPGPYFDGNTLGYQWDGTPDNSTSSIKPATTATIVRVNTSDGTVLAVRGGDPATLAGGGWVGQDYEVPLDDPFYYRASSTDVPGLELLSPTYTVVGDGRTLLKHPGRPALNQVVHVATAPSVSRPVAQGVFDVLGRPTPVAVSMRRSAPRGELQLTTYTEDERQALLLLLEDGTPLYLQAPADYGVGNVYVSIGDVTEGRMAGTGFTPERRWSLPFVVVDRPTGDALAVGNTWADVLADYGSWDELRAAGTWADVLEGLG
jgi:hypothetical protein